MVTPGLAIVIPALNEATTIGKVVTQAGAYGTVIVVDDSSTDGTADIACRSGADVVVHAAMRGYDGALNSGFVRASDTGKRFVVTLDADGQLPAELIPDFVRHLEQGASLVVGIRDSVTRISERAFRPVARYLYGIQDPFCGMKGYRVELFQQLGWFNSYRSIGTELAFFAASRGERIVQLPIPTKPRSGGSRMGGALKANWVLTRAALLGSLRHRRKV